MRRLEEGLRFIGRRLRVEILYMHLKPLLGRQAVPVVVTAHMSSCAHTRISYKGNTSAPVGKCEDLFPYRRVLLDFLRGQPAHKLSGRSGPMLRRGDLQATISGQQACLVRRDNGALEHERASGYHGTRTNHSTCQAVRQGPLTSVYTENSVPSSTMAPESTTAPSSIVHPCRIAPLPV